MKFLIDKSPADVSRKMELAPEIVMGQLLTPLTRYKNHSGSFAMDNGCFSEFHESAFISLLERDKVYRAECKFVTCPDIVGNARRTMELWEHRRKWIPTNWPTALVLQNGIEDMSIPWDELDAVFIGGDDRFKDGQAVVDIIKTAKILGKWVHVGRVNGVDRFSHFESKGADSCDGSGVSMYDHMLNKIMDRNTQLKLEISN